LHHGKSSARTTRPTSGGPSGSSPASGSSLRTRGYAAAVAPRDRSAAALGADFCRREIMSPKDALAFVEKHGVVLEAARSSIPNLAEAVAGERIRGSWWGHPKGREIFHAAEAVSESPEVLVCKLVDGKVTYVHRRLWPALVKLAARFPRARLAKVWNEHAPGGAHRARRKAFPTWVPREVWREAEALSVSEAERLLSPVLS